MDDYFRAVAVDYDGTLTGGGRPEPAILEALGRARASGRRVILVTGRILEELRGEFPDVADHFDALVAENGAVLHHEGVSRALTAPVPDALDGPLIARGVPFRRGQVLLACDGHHDVAVLEALRRIGLDCALSRNRGQLMVLPPGVTKGSGVGLALAQLGISRHSAVAVGDAENDQSLLEACEIGVATANAVPSLKALADVVLTEADGRGVLRLLGGALLRDELRVEPRRWQVDLGRAADGRAVTLPGSRANVLVTGGSGSGKSYLAGFFAERLVALGYSVCVFDPEGDHVPLGRLHDVVVLGGREPLPPPAQLARIVARNLSSVVVDLSFATADERARYVAEALASLAGLRAEAGVPHWVFVDEAHEPFGGEGLACSGFHPEQGGFCLVTWRPVELCRQTRGAFDFLLVLVGEDGLDAGLRREVAEVAGIPEASLLASGPDAGPERALLVRLDAGAAPIPFALAPRWVAHVRHWHKYTGAHLPVERSFHFRDPGGPTGATAHNLAEFHHEIRRCAPEVLAHHAGGGDFSRWIEDVIQDSTLAGTTRDLEDRLGRDGPEETDTLRDALLAALEQRYLG